MTSKTTRTTKLGLVFSGGGAKGAYEIGAWKALKEYGIDKNVKAVAGTSVGALNAVLFICEDYEYAENLWREIKGSDILHVSPKHLAKKIVKALFPNVLPLPLSSFFKFLVLPLSGLLSREKLSDMIDKVNLKKFETNEIPCYAVAVPWKYKCIPGSPKEILLNGKTPEIIKGYLLASSAIPVVFESEEVEGVKYYDGGVIPGFENNVPWSALVKEGCTHIICIHLDTTPEYNKKQNDFEDIEFWNIVPSDKFCGIIPALNFDPENIHLLKEQGYKDAIKTLQGFEEFQKTERTLDEDIKFHGHIKCPACSSKKTSSEERGFSFINMGIGIVALGPIGGVAGRFGRKNLVFVCQDCGKRWSHKYLK